MLKKYTQELLLIIPLFVFALLFVIPQHASAGSFGSLKVHTKIQYPGKTLSLNGVVVTVKDGSGVNYRGRCTSADYKIFAFGARSCSKAGIINLGTYPDTCLKSISATSASGYVSWAGIFSSCNCSFLIDLSAPAAPPGYVYDGGWSPAEPYRANAWGNNSTEDITFTIKIKLANQAPVPLRVSSTYGTDSDNDYSIPVGSTSIPITLSGKFTDEDDKDTGIIQIMYRKTTDSIWKSFGKLDKAEDPTGAYAAVANGITTRVSAWGWIESYYPNGSTIHFPDVNLGAGSYTWAVRAYDGHIYSNPKWSSQGSFVISDTPVPVEPATLSCKVSPENGLAPLVVKVSIQSENLSPATFDYDMDNDGTYEYSGRPGEVYYTYSSGGKYIIKVRHIWGLTATCSPNPITVTNPSDSSGGEVAP